MATQFRTTLALLTFVTFTEKELGVTLLIYASPLDKTGDPTVLAKLTVTIGVVGNGGKNGTVVDPLYVGNVGDNAPLVNNDGKVTNPAL